MDYLIWFNGEFIPRSDAKISMMDRGLRYGDSVFDTERTFNGKIFRLQDHLDRLYRSSEGYDFDNNIIIPISDNNEDEIEVNIDGHDNDTETSYMSNLNSENFIETYGINIKELQLSDMSNTSSNSDYSEEINSDEINDYESQIL